MLSNVYLIQCIDTSFYKIGVADDPVVRLVDLQAGCPYKLLLIMTCGFQSRVAATTAEADVHRKLSKYNIHREWFNLSPEMAEQLKFDMVKCSE